MDEQRVTTDILKRLRRVEGQVRGIQRMVEEGRDCEAIVTQLMAARAALDRAGLHIMTHHIQSCLLDPTGEARPDQLSRVVEFFFRFAGPLPGAQMVHADEELFSEE